MADAPTPKRVAGRWALIPAILAMGCLAACNSANQPKLGRAEGLYKSLGGPDFVGPDGGMNTNIIFNWFDAHPEYEAKFDGKDGICKGYQPAGEMSQRERDVCAGAAHTWLVNESKRERAH